jgi:hypothetical protein
MNHLFLQSHEKRAVVPTNPEYDIVDPQFNLKLKDHHYTKNLFGPVADIMCKDFKEAKTPVLVTWMVPDGLQQLDKLIGENEPEFFLATGAVSPPEVYEKNKTLNLYSLTIITPKMLCHHDRDGPSGKNDSRSLLLWYRRNKPALSDAEVTKLCGKENLGQCAGLHDEAVRQDLLRSDYEFKVKNDPSLRFTCGNPACPGCPYVLGK